MNKLLWLVERCGENVMSMAASEIYLLRKKAACLDTYFVCVCVYIYNSETTTIQTAFIFTSCSIVALLFWIRPVTMGQEKQTAPGVEVLPCSSMR